MRLLPIALILSFFLTAISAHAAYELDTDYVLRLPDSVVDKLAGTAAPRKGEEKIPLADQAFEIGGAKVELLGSSASVRWELSAPKALGERAWNVSTSRLGAAFTVERLLLRTREVSEKDGLVIDNELNVECRNVSLRLKEEAGAGVSGVVRASLEEGKFRFKLEDYRGQWPASAWAVESLDCPGVAGIGTKVASRILGALADVSLVDAAVRPALERALLAAGESASAGLLGAFSLPTGIDGVTVAATGGEVREIQGGFEMRGRLRFHFAKARNQAKVEARFRGSFEGKAGQQSAELLLPEAALNSLLEAGFQGSLLKHDLRSRELEGFRALTQSRFRQFFAWPDLRRFPKDTDFLFRLAPASAPALKSARGTSGGIQGQVGFPLSIRMFAPIEQRWFPYVEFRTRVDAGISLRLQGGALKVRVNAAEAELQHAFSREYTDRFRPRTRISTRRLAPALFQALNENELTVKLPALKVGSASFVPSGFGLVGSGAEKAIRLEFSPK